MVRLVVFSTIIAGVFAAGIRHPLISLQGSRIINGVDANLWDVPHQLSLRRFGGHICGASAIANNWAVTAAHCVESLIGSGTAADFLFDVTGTYADGSDFKVNVEQIIRHPEYNRGEGAFPNDIAVLRLDSTYNLGSLKIRIADSFDGDFAGDICVISGWGVTEDGSSPSILKLANVTVYSNNECGSIWDALASIDPAIVDQHICVMGQGGDGTGACNGDSGGPLTCRDWYGEWVLAGATSWGANPCHEDGKVKYPAVYARVSYFYDWINENCDFCLL